MRGGLYKGLLGGSRPWLWVGAAAWGWNKLANRKVASSALVFSQDVLTGTALEVRVVPPPPTRREVRAGVKAEREAREQQRQAAERAAKRSARDAKRDAKRAV
jgi:hypothetical protein